MKSLPIAACLCLALLSGCATLSDADRAALQQHRVPPPLQERMNHRESLELADVTELSRRGVPPDFIMRYLRSTGRVYSLSSLDVVKLRDAGVRPGVIDYMMSTPALYAPRYADPWYGYGYYGYDPHYYYNRPVVIVRDRRGRR